MCTLKKLVRETEHLGGVNDTIANIKHTNQSKEITLANLKKHKYISQAPSAGKLNQSQRVVKKTQITLSTLICHSCGFGRPLCVQENVHTSVFFLTPRNHTNQYYFSPFHFEGYEITLAFLKTNKTTGNIKQQPEFIVCNLTDHVTSHINPNARA